MSEQQPPFAAPPGYVWTKSWFGLGSWVLIEDQQFPLPPAGFRYQTHFWTGRRELVPVVGPGVNFFSDGNAMPQPAPRGISSTRDVSEGGFVVMKQPPPVRESGGGVDFLGGQDQDKRLLAVRAQERRRREILAAEFVRSG